MTQPSVSGRITAAIFRGDLPGNRRSAIAQQRRLPLGRRLLTSLLGIQVRRAEPSTSVRNEARRATTAPSAGQRQEPPASPSPTPHAAPGVRADEWLGPEDSAACQHGTKLRQRHRSTGEKPPATSHGGSHVPPHLLSEDRQDYERLLDEALRSAPHRPELAAVGQRLNPEQLRTMALNATALITAVAETEYQHYVNVREQRRRPTPYPPPVRDSAALPEPDAKGGGVATTTMGEVAETAGAGAIAVVAVLAPILAGTAAGIFLGIGYLLKLLDPEPGIARHLLTAGWIFGAITAASILVAAVGLLLAALRNDAGSPRAGAHGERSEEVSLAREAWHEALLERGIMPFLSEALAGPSTATLGGTQLGYSRSGFSSPGAGPAAGPRPSYSRPDFTSPDFEGESGGTPPTQPEQVD